MQGKKIYTEKLFIHFQLSERVPENNFYRRLKDALDLHFIYTATERYYGKEGQKSIDPVVFFKLLLVGYFENLNSDRQIIAHASMRLDILYFINYNIDDKLPCHSTLSRTRQLYGEEVFRGLFKKVLTLCIEKGMVGGKRQALDSAYIKANASMDSLEEKPVVSETEILNDGDAYSRTLLEQDETPQDKQANPNPKKSQVKERKLPIHPETLPQDKSQPYITAQKKKEVEEHHEWKEEAYKDQPKSSTKEKTDENGNLIRPKYLSNHTHHSPTDPDARISTKPGKPRELTYSAQTSVDTKQHVITNIMADYSDKRDSESLPQAVAQTQVNLQENDLQLEEVLADAGYSSGEALRYLKENNITGYIPNFGQYKAEREGFIYNKEKDQYECQQGKRAILPFKKIATDSKGYSKKIYRSDNSKCKNCPLRASCIGKSDFKKIEDSIEKPLYDEMHQRLQSAKAKRMKKLRSATVEPVLGTLINFMGMRRVWTRGIAGATKFFLGAAIAYNLKKWLNYQPKKAKVAVMMKELPKEVENCLKKGFIFLFRHLHTPPISIS